MMSGEEGEQLPLVVMVDFLADASIEAEVLKGVARVECWQVEGHHALPDHLHVPLSLPLPHRLLFFFYVGLFLVAHPTNASTGGRWSVGVAPGPLPSPGLRAEALPYTLHHSSSFYNKTGAHPPRVTRHDTTRHDTTHATRAGEGTKTKVLVRVGMGIDSVDLQAAGERGTPKCPFMHRHMSV
jgi:hypothetical protein